MRCHHTPAKEAPMGWVEDQIAEIERTGTTESVDINGMRVMLVRMTGAKSGNPRPVPLMRVERDGVYAAVASKGGAPKNPVWTNNLDAYPDVVVQDGTVSHDVRARSIDGEEHAEWWKLAVSVFPPYAEYQANTERTIPIYLLEPR
ncbi:nitroreductase family deazaflavin-dependent oxidoreductase [Micrococcales bacterium 31B]|nr:nitroreductase family deazaflavin-dependent oxidoreductase [Micrococcales bacterium 31B]